MNELPEPFEMIAFLDRVMRFQDRTLSPEELAALEAEMIASPEKRHLFAEAQVHSMSIHEWLRQEAYRVVPLAPRPIRRIGLWLRPIAALAAGVLLGIVGTSLLWACTIPATVRATFESISVANGSFESADAPVPDGLPTTTGIWSGDFSAIVSAEQGIAPADGHGMLRFLRPDHRRDPPGNHNHVGNMYQIVDMRPWRAKFAGGNKSVELSARFNCVPASGGERYRFGVNVVAFTGDFASLPELSTSGWHGTLARASRMVVADNDPATWQHVAARISGLPAETDYLLLEVLVERVCSSDPGIATPFAGHYVDDIQLTLIDEPLGTASHRR